MIKKLFSVIICFGILLSNMVYAEEIKENNVFKNISSETVANLMENTIMLQPGSETAFVYGKRVELNEAVYSEGSEIYVLSSFLKENFNGCKIGEDKFTGVFGFAKENGLNIKTVNNTLYLSDKNYKIPQNIPFGVDSFFGIYVSTEGNGTGTFQNPVSDIKKAKNRVSEIKSSIGFPEGGITVYLREGNYTITEGMGFSDADSGFKDSPVTYKAYKGEKVSFNGGISVKGSEFKKVENEKYLSVLPNAENVVSVDLGEKLAGFDSGYKIKDPENWVLTYKDQKLQIARWPDKGFAKTGSILESGANGSPDGFRFVVGDTRVKNWVSEEDARIFGYFGFTWYGERKKMVNVNPVELSVKADVVGPYGVTAGKQYYVYNMVSELDRPGEYYLDKENNTLYIYPVEGSGDSKEFRENEVQFALLEQTMINMNNCKNIVFDGIIFENTLGQVCEMQETCENITFKGCTFKNICKGIIQRGYNNLITGCDFYNITDNPVTMNGGDRATLKSSGSVITNCTFRDFNTVSRTNCGAVRTGGVGDVISHNEFMGGPHTVVTLAGNENIIEYNEFYDNMQDKAEDASPIYGGRNLSHQNNVVRYNYFHDIYPTMGCVYLDDALANQHIYGNVCVNTARVTFVHGGVNNTIKDNLVINPKTDAASVRVCGNSWSYWDISTATSEAGNNFLWNLVNLPWQSEVWQKYNDSFKYMGKYPENYSFPPYGCEITGNVVVMENPPADSKYIQGMEAGPAVRDHVKIQDNTVISGEASKNYEIPENYKEIMENAGVYVDDSRTTLEKTGNFDMLRPYDKIRDVEANEVEFEWSKAENASKYLFTLATDENFQNIISNKYVDENSVTIEKLNYAKTRYFWKVTAIPKETNAMEKMERVPANKEYFSFTTKQAETIDRTDFDEIYAICLEQQKLIIEGENPGEHKIGTTQMADELLKKYKGQSESLMITNKALREMTENLQNEFNFLLNRKNPAYFDMKSAITGASNWSMTPNQGTIFGMDKMKYTTVTDARFGTAEKLPVHEIVKFSMVVEDLTNWIGFGIRAQNSPTAVAWAGNPQYLFIIKENAFEMQKFGEENYLKEYPNNIVKPGEKHEYEFIADNQDDGSVIVTVKIDGNVIVEYHDTENPHTEPGYFEVYGPGEGRYMEIYAE